MHAFCLHIIMCVGALWGFGGAINWHWYWKVSLVALLRIKLLCKEEAAAPEGQKV